jgi:hypothetical protein
MMNSRFGFFPPGRGDEAGNRVMRRARANEVFMARMMALRPVFLPGKGFQERPSSGPVLSPNSSALTPIRWRRER